MANNFSYGVYKNEFNATMVEFFKQTFDVESETEKVLTLTNMSEDDCKNIAACMFKSVEECKAIFPVKTIEEEVNEAFGEVKCIKSQMCDIMLKVMNSPAYKAGGIKNADYNSEVFSKYEKMFYLANEMMRICDKF